MYSWLAVALLGTLALGQAGQAPAPEDVRAILDRAIQAHGGAEKLRRFRAVRTRAKGRIEIQGGLPFTQQAVIQLPAQMKDSIQVEANGQTISVTTVYDFTQGWVRTGGQTAPMPEAMLKEMRETLHLMDITRLVGLKDAQAYQLTPLGETRVQEREAVGIKVTSRGYRDVSLYFDKPSGLLLKTKRRTYDFGTRGEVDEERFFRGYEDVDGMKTPRKVLIERDGKKYMQGEVTEVKYLEKVPDSEFTEPGAEKANHRDTETPRRQDRGKN